MLYSFRNKRPNISVKAFIAESACIIGDVSIGEGSSVWFNSVIRGDRGKIIIGKASNIQDAVVIHTGESTTEIGDEVSIGHGCVIHGCRIKNNVLVGMNATIMDGAEIGEFCIVGAGSLVPPNHIIPDYSVVYGVPCKHIRKCTEEDIKLIKDNSKVYVELAEKYHRVG